MFGNDSAKDYPWSRSLTWRRSRHPTGPFLDSLRAAKFKLFEGGSATRRHIILAGELPSGRLLEFWVPDLDSFDGYTAELLEVAAAIGYAQRDLQGYAVEVERPPALQLYLQPG